jgi:RimJ/RimL family protein N-acetyltransferase
MELSATPATVGEITRWRDLYRHEMNCQIVHDSLHARDNWTQSYLLSAGGTPVGYGAIVMGGPWVGKPAVFEFYVVPQSRSRVFDLFEALLAASRPVTIDTQTNDPLLPVMLHTFARDVASESILYHDRITTAHAGNGAVFRRTAPEDAARIAESRLDPEAKWLLEVEGTVAATGGILFHYNRPYGDIFMQVAEPFRRRGLGCYLVQELKRACNEGGSVPVARCNPDNVASRKTLQKAGFVPCGHILVGSLPIEAVKT